MPDWLDRFLVYIGVWAESGDEQEQAGGIMRQLSWQHDVQADFKQQWERGSDVAAYWVIRHALQSLDGISSVEVITGDDARLDEARHYLRIMRNRIDP